MILDELRNKYPKHKIIYEPNPNCKYCHGAGERPTKLPSRPMTCCVCVCVHPSVAEQFQDSLTKLAKEYREDM